MKKIKIGIIGAGISGLRAGLELKNLSDVQVEFWDKSNSPGGRVATRRLENDCFINHGATRFDRYNQLMTIDSHFMIFQNHISTDGSFKDRATGLAKSMVQNQSDAIFNFNNKIMTISTEGTKVIVNSTFGEIKKQSMVDYLLISSPLPQSRDIISSIGVIPFTYSYANAIIFYFQNNLHVKQQRHDEIEEKIFDKTDEDLLKHFGLDSKWKVKKWRYAKVKSGSNDFYCPIKPNIILIGDAFCPDRKYDLASAWLSGGKGAQFIQSSIG